MELRRPLLVATGAAVALLAAVPQTLSMAVAAPATVESAAVEAASVVPFQESVELLARPGRTVTLPTTHTYKGQRRHVVIHVPDGLLAPAPLVVALHAHSQEPKAIRAYSRLEQLADEQGFVVAFPQGAAGSWNAGTCCVPASKDQLDDVGFLDEVLSIVRTQALIDTSRISLTGGSNGAMMALRYACERPDVVASVAVVSGPLIARCPLGQPVPVLVLHGARDTVVPLRGGRNAFLGVTFPPVDRSLEPFRKAKGEVRLQVVPRAGHDWMTREEHGVDATLAAWLWMRDHPRA